MTTAIASRLPSDSHYLIPTMYDTRRINSARGYLEVIHRDDAPIAYITDAYGGDFYVGIYGIHEIHGRTVAAVKSELFALIESGV